MNDWNGMLEGIVNQQVKKLVASKREEMMIDWDAPADFNDPLGGMSAVELEHIQELLSTYETKVRRKVENQVFRQWLAHLQKVITFE